MTTTQVAIRRRSVLQTLGGAALAGGLLSSTAGASAHNGTVLILDSTVTGGENSLEADSAAGLGFDVDVVSDAQWSAMTTADFAAYRAIILGDPTCVSHPGPLAAAEATVGTWSPAVTGNVIVLGTDPTYHSTYGPGGAQGGDEITAGGISFAAADPDHTGAYITTSCYYHGTAPDTPVPVLDGFGTFTATGVPGCFNDIAVVATHPDLIGYTEANLSDWNCSVHNAFDTWPLAFEVVGLALDGTAYTAPGGEVGTPYILARGAAVISDITLGPDTATVPVGQSHDLTATVEYDDQPLADTTVTFTVIDGPHETTSGTATTDASGEASFSYAGTAVGIDTIEASFTDPAGVTQRSNRVTAEWIEPEVETVCVDLLAGQDRPVGEVCVVNDGEHLLVTYETSEDCVLTETHLAVSADEAGSGEWVAREHRWQNRSGNPAPGRFPYTAEHDPAVNSYTYTIALADITGGVAQGDHVILGAHAVVDCDGDVETAWGDGDRFVDRGNWATHFAYDIQ